MTKIRRCVILLTCMLILPTLQAQERSIYWTENGKILRGDDNGAAYEEIISTRAPSAIVIAEGELYWIEGRGSTIRRSSLDGTESQIIVSGIDVVTEIIFDPKSKQLFWLEEYAGKIWRANLDGTEVMTVIKGSIPLTGLALDSLAGKLYWVDGTSLKMRRSNLDSTQVEDVFPVQGFARGIAFDVNNGKIYWIVNSTREIKRADLNGSDLETVLSDITPFDLALDPENNALYIGDVERIVRVNLDGTGLKELVTGFSFGVASLVLESSSGKMYWIDQLRATIQRANLDGTDLEDLLIGISPPQGVAVDAKTGKLYWTGWAELMRANLDGSSVEYLAYVGCGIGELSAIELHLKTGKMYWISNTDCGGPLLHRANLDGTNIEGNLLGTAGPPFSISLDHSESKVYWTNGLYEPFREIRRANLDGSESETLIDSLTAPAGIALDPQTRKIYWTGSLGTISRANYDGSDVEVLITGLSFPFDIALDAENYKMYWTERNPGKIRRANFDGSGIEDLFTGLNSPSRIALTFESGLVNTVEDHVDLPAKYELKHNYPNPFNPATTIEFAIPQASDVTLKIYNVRGEEVATLVSEKLPAGNYRRVWSAGELSSGVYFYSLEAGTFVQTLKLLLIK